MTMKTTIPTTNNPAAAAADTSLGEFGRIARWFGPLAAGFPGARGLCDDAAVFSVPAGMELVVTTDAMVAGVHFLPADPPADIAYKLLAVNLSDLAAKGAAPLAYSLALCLPKGTPDDWVAAFAAGLGEAQASFGVALSGGDSVSTHGPAVLSVTAMGLVPQGQAPSRDAGSNAAGALVCVIGTIGDGALGLACALGGLDWLNSEQRDYLLERLRRPTPRLAAGLALRGLVLATMDISDGLLGDLAHMARASGVAAEIDVSAVPLSAAAAAVLAAQPERIADVLTGGDDYELLLAVAPERLQAAQAATTAVGTPLAVIGRLTAGPAGRVQALDAEGVPLALARLGWTHD